MSRLQAIDWPAISSDLDAQGWAVMPKLLSAKECEAVAGLYRKDEGFRSKVVMARHGFGRGEYKYFAYPLPHLVETLRTALYPNLAPIANRWHEAMGIDVRFPAAHAQFIKRCHAAGQTRPTPLLLQYGRDDYNCLHQDLYGEHVFPLQVAILLSEPGEDFEGGEFVLTEQRPRMQSRAMIVPLKKGDAVVFAVIAGRCKARAASIGAISGTASASCARAIAIRSASSFTTLPNFEDTSESKICENIVLGLVSRQARCSIVGEKAAVVVRFIF